MRKGSAIILSDYVGGEGAGSGGAGHAALDSFRALRAAGADVRIVTGFGTPTGVEPDRLATLGGRDLRGSAAADTLRAIYNREARDRLSDELAGEDAETTLVILHQWTRYLSPAALGIVSRFPTMVYMHDYFWACPNGAYYDFKQGRPCDRRPMHARCLSADCDRQGRAQKAGRVARQVARQALTRAPRERRLFLHLSEQSRRTIGPLLGGERHAILYNPLPLADPLPHPPEPRHRIGYFGRLEPEKGVGILLDAVTMLGLSGLFVGEGSLLPEVQAHAGIVHRAWQPRETMAAAMRSCAVVVLPSLWRETWGLIVPEAMAAGVPVLVSSRAGSAELVRRFGGGTTFDPGVTGDLAASLGSILAAPPVPTHAPDALRAFLSPARHAERIIALAQTRFGIDLCKDEARISAA